MATVTAPRPLRLAAVAGAIIVGSLLAEAMPAAVWSATRPATDAAPAPAAAVVADSASAGGGAWTGAGAGGLSAPTGSTIKLTPVASGLTKPVFITSAHDGTGRLFIVEQTGRIKVLAGGSVRSTPLLNIASQVSKGDEQGLLGLAFHPNFKSNHKFYVNFTNTAGDTIIRQYRTSTSNPNVVASGSGKTILKINQPYSNHNGGMIAFGPDGFLYIGMGDGGGAGDPQNRAQNKDALLGKMLRININAHTSTKNYTNPSSNPYVGRKGRNEIWQRGLRNPWRWSFDRKTGSLWIGDVGQNQYEEIDRAVRTGGGAGRGVNFGWSTMEGFACYKPSTGCNKSGRQKPLLAYSHANGRCVVTGGYVYRGSAIPALQGYYVFADFCTGQIWAVRSGASSPASRIQLKDTSLMISSFGENAGGELFVVDLNGAVYRIDKA
jgi:glucose/arabinose dehydrogenase